MIKLQHEHEQCALGNTHCKLVVWLHCRLLVGTFLVLSPLDDVRDKNSKRFLGCRRQQASVDINSNLICDVTWRRTCSSFRVLLARSCSGSVHDVLDEDGGSERLLGVGCNEQHNMFEDTSLPVSFASIVAPVSVKEYSGFTLSTCCAYSCRMAMLFLPFKFSISFFLPPPRFVTSHVKMCVPEGCKRSVRHHKAHRAM